MKSINKEQLRAILNYLQVQSGYYNLAEYGLREDCFCLDKTEHGWKTAFCEHGIYSEERFFGAETDACLDLLTRLVAPYSNGRSMSMRPLYAKHLRAILNYLKVPKSCYNLGEFGQREDGFCLDKTERGWKTAFCEHGVYTEERFFGAETDACLDLLNRLVHFDC